MCKVYNQSKPEEKFINIIIGDKQFECFVITTIEMMDRHYIVLLPKDKKYINNGELLVYRLTGDKNFEIKNIFDDAEFDCVHQYLMCIIQNKGYYQIIEKYQKIFYNESEEFNNGNNS